VLVEISEKDEPEVNKDEPTIREIEDPLPKVSEVISDVKNIETNKNLGRRLGNARHWRSSTNPVGFKLILPH
jgi:hypothetical protein